MRWFLAVGALLVMGCGGDSNCDEADKIRVFADGDGDGYGATGLGKRCAAGAGEAVVDGDCDDDNAKSYPGQIEVCDLVDNNCDGVVDEGSSTSTWYQDNDGDGFGAPGATQEACQRPGPGWVDDATDCDDANADARPGVPEVCNGYDDNCDGLADDDDPLVDVTTFTTWFPDSDGDGYGSDGQAGARCAPPPGAPAVTEAGDCDDSSAAVNPAAQERCNNIDDDCDGLIDDDDTFVVPFSQTLFYTDADLDGLGDPANTQLLCEPAPGFVLDSSDCDDTDPLATVVRDWLTDSDGDGVGAAPALGQHCNPPAPLSAPADAGQDCDDTEPLVYPGAIDVCEDGIDQDCTGTDALCDVELYTIRTSDTTLRSIDVQNLIPTEIGQVTSDSLYGDLAWHPTLQSLILSNGEDGAWLYAIDPATGGTTLLGNHGIDKMYGLAYHPPTGQLYGANDMGAVSDLHIVDPIAVTATYVGTMNRDEVGCMTYDTSRGVLIGYNGQFFSIDVATAATATLAGPGTLTPRSCAIAYDPSADVIWGVDWHIGQLVRFDPDNAFAETTVLPNFGSHEGLAHIP